jgi:hypothetical protein
VTRGAELLGGEVCVMLPLSPLLSFTFTYRPPAEVTQSPEEMEPELQDKEVARSLLAPRCTSDLQQCVPLSWVLGKVPAGISELLQGRPGEVLDRKHTVGCIPSSFLDAEGGLGFLLTRFLAL